MDSEPAWSTLQSNPYSQFFSFFGLRENPFAVSPDPRYLYMTRPIREAWDTLVYGIQSREGIIVLTGEAGTGKTTVINRLLDWLRERRMPTAYIFNSHLEPRHLFDFMLADFGVPADPRWESNALMALSQWLPARCREGQIPVLIVDEAQGLPLHVLEEIRLLMNLETPNEKHLQIVLAGQPELEEKLRRPELRQLKQRIGFRCRTKALTIQDAHEYIQARLRIAGASGKAVFSPDAVSAVHAYARGIPRVMNLLCEHALINAYAGNLHVVPARMVDEIAWEFQFDREVQAPSMRSTGAPVSARIYEPLVGAQEARPAARPSVHSAVHPGAPYREIAREKTEVLAGAPPVRPKEPDAVQARVPLVVPGGERPIENPAAAVVSRDLRHAPIVRVPIGKVAKQKRPITGSFSANRAMAEIARAMRRLMISCSLYWSNAGARRREILAGFDRWATRGSESRILNQIVVTAGSRVARAMHQLTALVIAPVIALVSALATGVERILGVWWREPVGVWQRQQKSLERWLQKPIGEGLHLDSQALTDWPVRFSKRFAASLQIGRMRQTPQPTIHASVRYASRRSASAPLRRWLREPFRPSQPLHAGRRAPAPRDRMTSAL